MLVLVIPMAPVRSDRLAPSYPRSQNTCIARSSATSMSNSLGRPTTVLRERFISILYSSVQNSVVTSHGERTPDSHRPCADVPCGPEVQRGYAEMIGRPSLLPEL